MSDSNVSGTSTQWTLVWRAAVEDSDHGRPALEQLIRRYWKPLYGFARLRGMSAEDAEDATQEFLSGLVDRQWLQQADPAKGRFRSYLLTAWKQFLIDQYRKEHRQRRGGGVHRVSIDLAEGETAYQTLAGRAHDHDRSFMIAWANNILETTRMRLADEYTSRGNGQVFDVLSKYLTTPIDGEQYDDLSPRLGLSASALRVALHRLRKRFGETLRLVVEETVDDPSEVDQELRELLVVLSGQ